MKAVNIINSDIKEKTAENVQTAAGPQPGASEVRNPSASSRRETRIRTAAKPEKNSFSSGALLLMAVAAAAFVFVCGWLSLKLNINGKEEGEAKPTYGALGLYYDSLSQNGKKLYNEIAYCADSADTMSEILPLGVHEGELTEVLTAICRDECDMFYIDVPACYADTSGEKSVITLSYRYDSPTIGRMRDALAQAADAMADEIRSSAAGEDDISVILALHDTLIQKTAKAAADYDDPNKSNAYGALVGGSADAEGYAYAVRELLKRFGIESAVIYGSASGAPHVWNIVRTGDEWYHLDCYYDDPDAEPDPSIPFHAWFMTSDETVSDRTVDTGITIPECGGSYDYFRKSGYLCEDAENLSGILNTAINEADHDGKKYFELKAPTTVTEEDLLGSIIEIIKEHNVSRTASMTPAPYAEARIYDSGMPGVYTVQLYY